MRDNGSGRILCIDPRRRGFALDGRDPVAVHYPDSAFLELAPNDILFIDGSHISKTGSDVNHLFLRILPRMPKGVLVHIHDICLPYEYPKRWSDDVLCYWNEQYVLAALLANSPKWEILLGVYYLQKTAGIDVLKPTCRPSPECSRAARPEPEQERPPAAILAARTRRSSWRRAPPACGRSAGRVPFPTSAPSAFSPEFRAQVRAVRLAPAPVFHVCAQEGWFPPQARALYPDH